MDKNIIKQIRHPMDWIQIIAIIGSIAAMWWGFFTIIREDMSKMDARFEQTMTMNEAHWREMFAHMSGRIDNIKDGKPSPTSLAQNDEVK